MAKDYTKYNVSNVGEKFNKARLVQAIIKDYITKNSPNWEALQMAFPDNLQGKKCVVAKKSAVEKEKDFYMDAPYALSDGTEIVTCRQWGKDNILNFIAQAKTLGYSVLVDGGSEGNTYNKNSNHEGNKHQHQRTYIELYVWTFRR